MNSDLILIFLSCMPMLILIMSLSGNTTSHLITQIEDIRAVAAKITDYTLPEGFQEQFAIEVMDYAMVSLQGTSAGQRIYLIQAPQDTVIDVDGLQERVRNLEQAAPLEIINDLRVTAKYTRTIHGQRVSVLAGEGVNAENKPYRQVTALFEGHNGPAMVSVLSPVELWDQEMTDPFLASLK